METTKGSVWKNYRSSILLLGGIIVGCILGVVMGEKATVFAPIGDIFMNLMFTLVAPMVFVSVVTALGSMADLNKLGRLLLTLVSTFIATGAVAGVLILIIVNVFPPAANTSITMEMMDVGEASSVSDIVVSSLTVSDFPLLFSRSNMLPLIIAAIAFGIAMIACGGAESPIGKLMINLNDIIMKLVNMIMMLAPIGLGAYFAALVGDLGPQLIGDYGRCMLVFYPTIALYFAVFFPIYAYISGGKLGVRQMFKHIFRPALTAFATQSSCATLPVNMDACEKIGIPKEVSDVVLPLGCTMHMDGSVISAIVKIAFLYGIFGMPYKGVDVYAMSVAVAILGAFVLSGAPGGGMVSEMLIVSMFRFPPEAFAIIVTIGYLVDPGATCVNASGDAIASMIVARFLEGKDWLKNSLKARGERVAD